MKTSSILSLLVALGASACASENIPPAEPCHAPGEPCVGAAGFCDSDGMCRAECPAEPCLNATIEPGFGCVYSVRPNGWTCNGETGPGLCRDAECVRQGGAA